MAPKRKASRATEKLQDDVACLGSALTGKIIDSNLQEVMTILQSDPEQTCKVVELLHQNALKAPGAASTEDDGDMLQPSLNKVNLCSETLAREFLSSLLPAEAEEHLVEKKKAFLLAGRAGIQGGHGCEVCAPQQVEEELPRVFCCQGHSCRPLEQHRLGRSRQRGRVLAEAWALPG